MGSFGQSSAGAGLRGADRPMRGTGRAIGADLAAKRPRPKLKKVLPEVWKLMKPRMLLLSASFVLMVINRGAAFVLPLSFRPLVNKVMAQGNMALLPRIIFAVVGATLIQGIRHTR